MVVVDELDGRIGFLHGIIGSIGLQIIVIKLPVDSRPCGIQHPLDDGRGVGPSHTERLKHGSRALIIQHVSPIQVLTDIGSVAKTMMDHLVKLTERIHFRG